jgi:hypothetical protein
LSVQKEIFKTLGRQRYLKMPKPGTNPRGVEFSRKALKQMLIHKNTSKIEINWVREDLDYDTYKRWVDYWAE